MKKRYRCLGCDNIFNAEEPPSTIPTSVVYCPLCGGLAEIYDEASMMCMVSFAPRIFCNYETCELNCPYRLARIKAEKLDAIEALMREQPFIMVNINDQYSIQPRLSHKGTMIVSKIMAILFPDEPESS